MAYPVVLTGCGTALYVAPLQMLLTCDSLLVIRKTRVCRRRLYILRLKPKVICVTFHGGCIHFFFKTTRKEKGSAWEAVWIFGCSISNVLRSSYCLLLFANQFLPYIFLPSPELRAPGFPAVPAVTPFQFSPTNGAKAILVHPDYLNAALGGPPLGAAACLLASEVLLASL